jgi:hypothetical protein
VKNTSGDGFGIPNAWQKRPHLFFHTAYRKPFPGIFSSGKEWPGNGPVGGKPLQQVKVARWDYWKTTQKLEYEW